MANPLLQMFQQQSAAPMQMPNMTSMMPMLQKFMQFKETFAGDPKQQVQQLLSSGQMSQEQFNQLSQVAKQLEGVLGGMNLPGQK